MDDTIWLLLRGICRGVHLAGFFAAFGTVFFSAFYLPGKYRQEFTRLAWGGFAVAFLAGAAWFLLQSADFASATDVSGVLGAVPIVAQFTRFGHFLLGRITVLFCAVLIFQFGGRRLAALLAFSGVASEAWLGHGGAMGGRIGLLLLGISILHLATAAAWLGTLPALYIAILREPDALPLVRRFSRLGMVSVTLLLSTAFAQYCLLIANVQALITSGYGITALVKLLLFVALIVLAARNKLRLTPGLPATKPDLLRGVLAEIGLGFLVFLAAGLILQFAPPAMAAM